jgi:hypothetical protein
MVALFSLFMTLALAPPNAGEAAVPPPPADPFATTRACTKLLTRFVACGNDRAFKKILAQWAAASDLRLSDKRLQERLRAWAKPDGRRVQCAVWTGREGAADHIGESSPVARVVENKRASCHELGRALDETRWVARAMGRDE